VLVDENPILKTIERNNVGSAQPELRAPLPHGIADDLR
jgi:hypothetical protein